MRRMVGDLRIVKICKISIKKWREGLCSQLRYGKISRMIVVEIGIEVT